MDKKELIRKSAIKVIAKAGFHDSKVKTIADEAGIAAGTVYLYFKNKEDILDYIFCVEHKKRADFVKEQNKRDLPIDKIIDSFLEFHFNCFKNEPETAQVLYKEVNTVLTLKEQNSKYYMDEVFKAFSEILRKEQKNRVITKELDIDFFSASIINFLRISSSLILDKGDFNKFETVRTQLKEFVLHGLIF